MTDIDSLLDDRMSGGSGDYPPWFDEDPDDGDHNQGEPPIQGEGSILQGIVTGRRDDPWADDDEDSPKQILHVEDDDGNEWSTRTHSVLSNLIDEQDPQVGDMVRIEHTGQFKTDTGQVANDYQLGVVREEELQDLEGDSGNSDPLPSDGAGEQSADSDSPDTEFGLTEMNVSDVKDLVPTIDDVDQLEAMKAEEADGDNRKTAIKAIDERIEEIRESEETEAGDVPGDAVEFAESLIGFHGEMDLGELDEYLNETRDFEVDPADVAEAMDAEFDPDDERVYQGS